MYVKCFSEQELLMVLDLDRSRKSVLFFICCCFSLCERIYLCFCCNRKLYNFLAFKTIENLVSKTIRTNKNICGCIFCVYLCVCGLVDLFSLCLGGNKFCPFFNDICLMKIKQHFVLVGRKLDPSNTATL